MYGSRKNALAAAQRTADRRKLEDDAPRLLDVVPQLASLHIDVVEETGTSATKHRRHVVVGRAPALFLITCGDKACRDGGYDITHDVMRSLRGEQTATEGDRTCTGNVGSAPCSRRIHFELAAAYASA